MTKKKASEKADATAVKADGNEIEKQDSGESQPTTEKPSKKRQDGIQIDGFGLPVNGVARTRILGEIGADDPLTKPDAWNETKAAEARKLTEKFYG